jgi:DNA repair ATPase RecN
MTAVALYELAAGYRALLEKLSEGDFDLATIEDTIESTGIVDEIAQKAAGCEMVARTLEMHTPALDAEIERLTALKKRRQAAAKGLRDYLRTNMQAMGITKLESPLFVIKLQNNPPSVDVYEPGLIPVEFMTTPKPPEPAPNKTAIAAAIKGGEEVPGARLTQSQRLVVS